LLRIPGKNGVARLPLEQSKCSEIEFFCPDFAVIAIYLNNIHPGIYFVYANRDRLRRLLLQWYGERMDYVVAVEMLLGCE